MKGPLPFILPAFESVTIKKQASPARLGRASKEMRRIPFEKAPFACIVSMRPAKAVKRGFLETRNPFPKPPYTPLVWLLYEGPFALHASRL
jgi:hypothetical protein